MAFSELVGARLPVRLLDLPEPPERLYLHGELPRGPAVAIVGTRRPSPGAARFARRLAGELARAGVTILSGGARGIDTQAHRGALQGRGLTVVIAPAGFERAYPHENVTLYRRILERGGGYLSARAPHQAAKLSSFFERNAFMAALAQVVILVEAPFRSGARNTVQHARKLGRPLLVVPAAPWNQRGRGCILEIKMGARVLLGSRDVLDVLSERRLHPIPLPCDSSPSGRAQTARKKPKQARCHDPDQVEQSAAEVGIEYEKNRKDERATLIGDQGDDGEDLRAVLAAVRSGAASAEAIALTTTLPARVVQCSVLVLTLRGELFMDESGRIVPVTPGDPASRGPL